MLRRRVVAILGAWVCSLSAEAQVSPEIRRVNAALAQSLRVVISPPSRAALRVTRATVQPVELAVQADYLREEGGLSLGAHLEELSLDAHHEELVVRGAISFSPQMRKSFGIPLPNAANGILIEEVLCQKLTRFLDQSHTRAAVQVTVKPLRHLEWEVHLGYRVNRRETAVMVDALDCDLELSPQLLRGQCGMHFNSTSPQWNRGRRQTQEFVSGILRRDPAALQWWVDFVAVWDAQVRSWMN